MPCYHPMKGYRARHVTEKGKRPIVFDVKQGFVDMPVMLPCGRCIGCKLEHSRQWAMRQVHESQLHEENCFITLTFNDEHLPENRSVSKRDIQLFFKRLRKENYAKTIRYFACGEYGDDDARPHYHSCLFGHAFRDSELLSHNDGKPMFRSASLEKLWQDKQGNQIGFATVSPFSMETASYVARYVTKKDSREEAYKYIDKKTGEIIQLEKEFALMSRRPGIGKPWYDKFSGDIYPKDFTTIKGVKMRPPKYYDNLKEKDDPQQMARLKGKRKEVQNSNLEEQWHERQKAKEAVKIAQTKTIKRRELK